MKKFVFAAIAAMVMVSVSNVFASSKMMMDNSEVVPVDTVAPETPKDSAEISTPYCSFPVSGHKSRVYPEALHQSRWLPRW